MNNFPTRYFQPSQISDIYKQEIRPIKSYDSGKYEIATFTELFKSLTKDELALYPIRNTFNGKVIQYDDDSQLLKGTAFGTYYFRSSSDPHFVVLAANVNPSKPDRVRIPILKEKGSEKLYIFCPELLNSDMFRTELLSPETKKAGLCSISLFCNASKYPAFDFIKANNTLDLDNANISFLDLNPKKSIMATEIANHRYFRASTREGAETLLFNQEVGTFLIRPTSSTNENSFALSVVIPIDPKSGSKFAHIEFNVVGDKIIYENHHYDTLSETDLFLVNKTSKTPLYQPNDISDHQHIADQRLLYTMQSFVHSDLFMKTSFLSIFVRSQLIKKPLTDH